MVAYSFNARFETAIREGWKTQTIRATRRRAHARPGDMLQIYCGLRTAHCRKIVEDVRCTDVLRIVITFGADGGIDRITTDGVPVRDLDAFAQRDGFLDSDDMAAFWRKEHGPLEVFRGLLIEWHMPRAPDGRGGMTDQDIHGCANRLVNVPVDEFDLTPEDEIQALFGVALVIARGAGIDDHALYQSFGAFLEDNAQ